MDLTQLYYKTYNFSEDLVSLANEMESSLNEVKGNLNWGSIDKRMPSVSDKGDYPIKVIWYDPATLVDIPKKYLSDIENLINQPISGKTLLYFKEKFLAIKDSERDKIVDFIINAFGEEIKDESGTTLHCLFPLPWKYSTTSISLLDLEKSGSNSALDIPITDDMFLLRVMAKRDDILIPEKKGDKIVDELRENRYSGSKTDMYSKQHDLYDSTRFQINRMLNLPIGDSSFIFDKEHEIIVVNDLAIVDSTVPNARGYLIWSAQRGVLRLASFCTQ